MSQQLIQSARLATMDELAASIAHELNNPLATVSLRIESLLATLPEDDPKRRGIEVIEQEVDRMGNLVQNLLDFSRRTPQQISTLDVREEINNTIALVHYRFRKHKVEVVKEFASDLPSIQADRQQLRQLFLNIFTNAIDAMEETGGTLTIRVREAEKYEEVGKGLPRSVVIEVSDTGPGIAAEHRTKIMEPFFTTKPEGGGTGLGLPICRRIVQEHHGKLEINSEVGKGTTIRIILPTMNGHNARVLKDKHGS